MPIICGRGMFFAHQSPTRSQFSVGVVTSLPSINLNLWNEATCHSTHIFPCQPLRTCYCQRWEGLINGSGTLFWCHISIAGMGRMVFNRNSLVIPLHQKTNSFKVIHWHELAFFQPLARCHDGSPQVTRVELIELVSPKLNVTVWWHVTFYGGPQYWWYLTV